MPSDLIWYLSKMITIPYFTALTTFFSYVLLFAFGQLRDFFRKVIDRYDSRNLQVSLHTFLCIRYLCLHTLSHLCSLEMMKMVLKLNLKFLFIFWLIFLGICSNLLRAWRFLHSQVVPSDSGISFLILFCSFVVYGSSDWRDNSLDKNKSFSIWFSSDPWSLPTFWSSFIYPINL